VRVRVTNNSERIMSFFGPSGPTGN
jgi:hypothetical protein